MTNVPYSIEKRFKAELIQDSLSVALRRHLWRWLVEYFQFCERQRLSVRADSGKESFLEMLAVNGVASFQLDQATIAIERFRLLLVEGFGRGELGLEDSPDNGWVERNWDNAVSGLSESILGRHYSAKTEKCYVFWVERFREFLGVRPLEKVSASDAADFFTHLACKRKVAASTQNQAFSALLYFFDMS